MSQVPAISNVPARAPLNRRADDRIVAGVAAGVAAHLNASVLVVRSVFVVLALLSGVGVVAYGVLWVLMPPVAASESMGLEAAQRRGLRPLSAPSRRADSGTLISGGMLTVGLLWIFAAGGIVPSALFWPVVIGGVGVVVIWLQADERREDGVPRDTWSRLARGGGAMSIARLIGGIVLVGAGISWILASQIGLAQLPGVLGASSLLLAGLLVVSAPWLSQQRSRIRRAEAERLRAEARADMAAHLHDSVLQTLALIQRQSHDATTVASLARRQERELRTWLYGEPTRPSSLRSALTDLVAGVESRFTIDVELVCVGDATVTDRVEALLQALGEAVTNAAKHSGAPRVDVFVEVEADRIEAFVRDRGRGFDPEQVPLGRMGVRESIQARMERHGGRAMIRSDPGSGTEVRLEIAG